MEKLGFLVTNHEVKLYGLAVNAGRRMKRKRIKIDRKDRWRYELKQQNKQQNADAKVKIIPLGGLEQIGMNMTAIEYGTASSLWTADLHSQVMICLESTLLFRM